MTKSELRELFKEIALRIHYYTSKEEKDTIVFRKDFIRDLIKLFRNVDKGFSAEEFMLICDYGRKPYINIT